MGSNKPSTAFHCKQIWWTETPASIISYTRRFIKHARFFSLFNKEFILNLYYYIALHLVLLLFLTIGDKIVSLF